MSLARAATVVVTIETKAGVAVARLLRKRVEPGRLLFSWNGRTSGGRRLAYGGSYVMRVQATNAVGTVELDAPVRRPPRRTAAQGNAAKLRAVPVASILSSITELLTDTIGDYGLYAIFLLMLVDAVFPAASEPVMVYGGAVAAGAFAGQDVTLFGVEIEPGLPRVPRGRNRRHDRLPDRLAPGLVDRRRGRTAVPRAARPLVPPERRQARQGGGVVRPVGRLGGLPRAHHAGGAVVHLDTGRRLPHAARALHACSR